MLVTNTPARERFKRAARVAAQLLQALLDLEDPPPVPAFDRLGQLLSRSETADAARQRGKSCS